jgi:squalene-hopene/tetraprenyl-beta-curcumene cyclase
MMPVRRTANLVETRIERPTSMKLMQNRLEAESAIEKSLDKRSKESLGENLDLAIARARDALLELQHRDGYWCFELEADCTIPAEYIMMMHYMDEIDEALEAKIAVYLREHQCQDSWGWNLFCGGDFDLSCSVKAYYALKFAGDSPDAPHMVKARQAILDHGGAVRANVFTRYALALFGQIPWRGVPFLPVEIMLMPRWFPFHYDKVSYWSRTVMIPLSILYSLKPQAKNPKGVHIRELFTVPPEEERGYFPARSRLNRVFFVLERTGRLLESLIPRGMRRAAIKKAETWIIARLNGEDGLGGIFPAMVNALEVLSLLGYASDHPHRVNAKKALKKLLVIGDESAYCQPCVSPVWDTALSALALLEVGEESVSGPVINALDWLTQHQELDGVGDWRRKRPKLKAGGWAFQFRNPHYTDLDDTAVVARAMYRANGKRYEYAIKRATDWIYGMQSKNGGFASFEVDNTHYYLNEIPFADHGALLDPPTSDVSARCIELLKRQGRSDHQSAMNACLEYLVSEQEEDGSWFGRWGTNYIYGTWSVLDGLEGGGVNMDQPFIQKAVFWIKQMQRADGGWSEGCCTYCNIEAPREWESTSFQTAWALLGLMAAGEVDSPEVRRGVAYLMRSQRENGLWKDDLYTAPGFPRVFYLKYHGYNKYFPLWALARYRTLRGRGTS